MSGLDKIISGIALEAGAEAEKIKAEAKARAERIISRAREQEAEILQAAEESAARERRSIAMRAEAAAKAAEKRAVLKEKQNIISEIIDEAVRIIAEYKPDRYFSLMLRLVEKYAEDAPGEIIMSERAKTWITPEFSEAIAGHGLKIAEESGDITGGFILRYGEIEENCTVKALIEAQCDRLHDVISRFLFG